MTSKGVIAGNTPRGEGLITKNGFNASTKTTLFVPIRANARSHVLSPMIMPIREDIKSINKLKEFVLKNGFV